MTTTLMPIGTPAVLPDCPDDPSLGDYAHAVLQRQVDRFEKLESRVLADKDPEALHDFRVALRRLGTALTVFGFVLEIPKKASLKRVKKIRKTLGQLRDLDVQILELQETYRPQVDLDERDRLDRALKTLKKFRSQAFDQTVSTLRSSRYRKLKAAWKTWLAKPRYGPLAQLPLKLVAPDLLSPLLSPLLLHPGWLVTQTDAIQDHDRATTLHDLRKTCKQVRYQFEFFVDLYPQALQAWIKQVKALQDQLGTLHDAQVLQQILHRVAPAAEGLYLIQELVYQSQKKTLADWDQLRQTYLAPEQRSQLRQLVSTPLSAPQMLPKRNAEASGEGEGDRQTQASASAPQAADQPNST